MCMKCFIIFRFVIVFAVGEVLSLICDIWGFF